MAAAYEREGPGAAASLQGALAWVVWDGRRRRLVAARDRLGTQPVFFAADRERFVLADSAAAVLSLLDLPPQPDAEALVGYLHGLPPLPGQSYLRGVGVVEAGELLIAGNGALERRRYWSPKPAPRTLEAGAGPAVLAGIRRAVADGVPRGFGVTLSGGLDSASVAAVLAERTGAPPVAITWTAPDLPTADEGGAAAEVASALGLRHHLLRGDHLWPLSLPRDVASDLDAPALLPYPELWRALCVRASELGLAGLATGAGGDHLFGYAGAGLYTYPDLLLRGRWLELLRQIRAHRSVSTARLGRILDLDLLRPLLRAALPALQASRRRLSWVPRRHRLVVAALRRSVSAAAPGLSWRRSHLEVLANRSLPWLLAEIARQARRHGLDVRHPLLDSRLVELSAALPAAAVYAAGTYKVALRQAMRGRLPAALLERREKLYPNALFHHGLRGPGREAAERLLDDMRCADLGLVDPAGLRASFARYLEGGSDTRFWRALALEAWLRAHF